MTSVQDEEVVYNAAEAIDSLLEADDGQLLAAMSHYRDSMVTLFGRDGIVEMLRKAVDAAPNVEYFTKRSRREIDPARPQVNVKINDTAAMTAHPQLIPAAARPRGDLGTGASDKQHEDIVRFKSAVLFEEVCIPLATEMNEALHRHWGKAKDYLVSKGVDRSSAVMLLTNLFVVRVARDPKVHSADKMCVLGIFI
jgi:hypothetical protein